MNEPETLTIRGQLVKCVADRTRYKNYVPEIWFDRLYVDIQVPKTEAYYEPEVGTIVTIDGLMLHIIDPLATALETMHDNWEVKKAKLMEKRDQESQHTPKPKKKETQVNA